MAVRCSFLYYTHLCGGLTLAGHLYVSSCIPFCASSHAASWPLWMVPCDSHFVMRWVSAIRCRDVWNHLRLAWGSSTASSHTGHPCSSPDNFAQYRAPGRHKLCGCWWCFPHGIADFCGSVSKEVG